MLPFELNLDGQERKCAAALERAVRYHCAVADVVRRLPMQLFLVEIGLADAQRWQHGQFQNGQFTVSHRLLQLRPAYEPHRNRSQTLKLGLYWEPSRFLARPNPKTFQQERAI